MAQSASGRMNDSSCSLPLMNHPAPPDRKPVAADGDHALDEVRVRALIGGPGARAALRLALAADVVVGPPRRLEHHHVATLRVAEPQAHAVHQHALAHREGRHHRLARDPEGLDEERLDAERQSERDGDDRDQLDERAGRRLFLGASHLEPGRESVTRRLRAGRVARLGVLGRSGVGGRLGLSAGLGRGVPRLLGGSASAARPRAARRPRPRRRRVASSAPASASSPPAGATSSAPSSRGSGAAATSASAAASSASGGGMTPAALSASGGGIAPSA